MATGKKVQREGASAAGAELLSSAGCSLPSAAPCPWQLSGHGLGDSTVYGYPPHQAGGKQAASCSSKMG